MNNNKLINSLILEEINQCNWTSNSKLLGLWIFLFILDGLGPNCILTINKALLGLGERVLNFCV